LKRTSGFCFDALLEEFTVLHLVCLLERLDLLEGFVSQNVDDGRLVGAKPLDRL
jgi:hypothetical protein